MGNLRQKYRLPSSSICDAKIIYPTKLSYKNKSEVCTCPGNDSYTNSQLFQKNQESTNVFFTFKEFIGREDEFTAREDDVSVFSIIFTNLLFYTMSISTNTSPHCYLTNIHKISLDHTLLLKNFQRLAV